MSKHVMESLPHVCQQKYTKLLSKPRESWYLIIILAISKPFSILLLLLYLRAGIATSDINGCQEVGLFGGVYIKMGSFNLLG